MSVQATRKAGTILLAAPCGHFPGPPALGGSLPLLAGRARFSDTKGSARSLWQSPCGAKTGEVNFALVDFGGHKLPDSYRIFTFGLEPILGRACIL